MGQTAALLDSLKREMRHQGKTYADAARVLSLSEASVKRLFSNRQFSLARVDSLCEWLGLDFSDLVRMIEESRTQVRQLEAFQEQELVADTQLLLMTMSLLNRWRFDEVIETYTISETEGIRHLAKLDRMGLIELLPGNRVKLRISRDFDWRPGGPIERFFEDKVQSEFFASRFDGPGETRTVLSGMLSVRANAELQRKMERLVAEFHTLHQEDERLPIEERYGTSLVMAMRPWEPSVFQSLRRLPSHKRFKPHGR